MYKMYPREILALPPRWSNTGCPKGHLKAPPSPLPRPPHQTNGKKE